MNVYFWSEGNNCWNQRMKDDDVDAQFVFRRLYKQTYRNKKFFDLLQSVTHSHIRFSRRREHLDQHVKIFVKVMILCLTALSQFFFLLAKAFEKRKITHLQASAIPVEVQELKYIFLLLIKKKKKKKKKIYIYIYIYIYNYIKMCKKIKNWPFSSFEISRSGHRGRK